MRGKKDGIYYSSKLSHLYARLLFLINMSWITIVRILIDKIIKKFKKKLLSTLRVDIMHHFGSGWVHRHQQADLITIGFNRQKLDPTQIFGSIIGLFLGSRVGLAFSFSCCFGPLCFPKVFGDFLYDII